MARSDGLRCACLVVSWLAGVACGPDDEGRGPEEPPDAGEPLRGPVWSEAFDTSDAGSLSGVWGSRPDDVFVVGGTERQGEVYHYDGGEWTPMQVPDVGLLVWVHGFGPDDVYAVGLGGGVVHYDGAEWSALDSGTDEDLWGVFGFTADDIWIVGGDPFENDPVILHYDGDDFESVPLAEEENSRSALSLFKVWGIGSELIAVGQRGLILHWDGAAWREKPAGAEAGEDFISLWGTSDDNVVAVGGRGNGRIARYDGEDWTTIAPEALGGINAVFMDDDDTAVIGGFYGFVGEYAPADDSITPEKQEVTFTDIHAIWGDGEGTYYAVAGSFLPPFEGAALVRRIP